MILPGRVLLIMFLAGVNFGLVVSNVLPYRVRLVAPIAVFLVILVLSVWWLIGYRAATRRTRI